jgi:hypothetical protein
VGQPLRRVQERLELRRQQRVASWAWVPGLPRRWLA